MVEQPIKAKTIVSHSDIVVEQPIKAKTIVSQSDIVVEQPIKAKTIVSQSDMNVQPTRRPTIEVLIDSCKNIKDLKLQISKIIDLPPERQTLTYNSKILKDDKLISEYNMTDKIPIIIYSEKKSLKEDNFYKVSNDYSEIVQTVSDMIDTVAEKEDICNKTWEHFYNYAMHMKVTCYPTSNVQIADIYYYITKDDIPKVQWSKYINLWFYLQNSSVK